MKRIAILGSTGSIGTQALEVIEQNPEKFKVTVLTAHSNVELLVEQAKKFQPEHVIVADSAKYTTLVESLASQPIKVHAGHKMLEEIVQLEEIDVVLTALVGFSGLLPTIKALQAGKNIALANKETLVVAGELITRLAKEKRVSIYPVDSEHSAIFQCIVGEEKNPIEKIYLTASGGPFRGYTYEQLKGITPKQALAHPNWNMGNKVTIDSASLMNKGLEAIEARWLFTVDPSQIEIVVHPQSIIHSMVQFTDGSIKAQMGLPDMRLPIQYAMGYPERLFSNFPRFNFTNFPTLTFEKPNLAVFHNLQLAYKAMEMGGNAPCILNAANEIAVESFLKNELPFIKMPEIISEVLNKINLVSNPTLDDYMHTNHEARKLASEMVQQFI